MNLESKNNEEYIRSNPIQPTDSTCHRQHTVLCGSHARHTHHPVHRLLMVVDTHLRMLCRGGLCPIQHIHTMKQCTKCGEIKDVSEFYLVKGKSGNRNVDSWCKVCRIKGSAKHRKVHPTGVYRDPHDGRLRIYERKHGGRKLYWTGDMLSILKRYYPNTSNIEIAEMIGVCSKLVAIKAKELGMSKSESYRKECCRKGAQLRMINNKRKKKI